MKELRVTYRAFGAAVELGTLADDGSDVLFQYAPAAIAQRLELSPIRLPLRPQAYPDEQAQYVNLLRVPGLLHDSLPDGWGFRLMDRRMQARGIDPATASTLDRLAYLGENTMGALTYAPATSDLTGGKDLGLLELAGEVQAVLSDESHEVLAEMARAGGSAGGARPKAVVHFNSVTGRMSTQAGHAEGAEPWLIKFRGSDDAVDSCALEALYAQVAQACGMGMAPTQFFELNARRASGLTAFGTKRFDRLGEQRIHVHSLAGLLHANFQIPSLGYADFFRTTRRLTRDHRELKKAVRRCAFNVLMHNRDDHSKNIAFLLDQENNWRLAPPFDLTYCPGYQGEHFMDVAGEGKMPARSHIVKAAQAAGLDEKDAATIIDEVLDGATDAAFKALAKALPVRARTVTEVAKTIDGNRKRLSGNSGLKFTV